MEKKVCSKCKGEKDVKEFNSGRNRCKLCIKEYNKEYSKEYYENNKDNLKEYNKEYYKKCGEKIKERTKEYYEYNKEYYKEYNKEYKKKNKEILSNNSKEYREKNKEILSNNSKEYRKKNKDKLKEYRENNKERIKEYYENNKDNLKEYREKNKERILYKKNQYVRLRSQSDPIYKLTRNIRNLIRISTKNNGYSKKSKTYNILGCTYEEFKLYIESQFKEWMNWDNYGKYNGEERCGWDFDHIIPISSSKCEEDVIRLNHYSNIQPLCSYINRYVKRDKIDYDEI